MFVTINLYMLLVFVLGLNVKAVIHGMLLVFLNKYIHCVVQDTKSVSSVGAHDSSHSPSSVDGGYHNGDSVVIHHDAKFIKASLILVIGKALSSLASGLP